MVRAGRGGIGGSSAGSRSERRRWALVAGVTVLAASGAVAALAIDGRLGDRAAEMATGGDGGAPEAPETTGTQVTPPTNQPDEWAEGPPATIDVVESAPGRWRPPHPDPGESLVRFAAGAAPAGDLVDGPHFGIVHGLVDTSGRRSLIFSRGVRYTGDAAAEARARALADAGVDEDDPMPIRHDWWTPEWGVGMYIEPDFELPVEIPVDASVTITVHDGSRPNEVAWSEFVAAADGDYTLPWYWAGHSFVTVVDGVATHIENMWTP